MRRALTAAALAACVVVLALPVAGSAREPRIVGGQVAPVGAYPWMVALVAAGAEPEVAQGCGGTMIGPNRVLTAAHCIGGFTPDTIDAVVGRERLSDDAVGRRIGIARYALDPEGDDVAILELEEIVNSEPLALATPADAAFFAAGQPATTIGWGATSENAGAGSDDLRHVEVPIVSRKECREAYRTSGGIPPNVICAGAKGLDSCTGDSGGPLIVRNADGVPLQVGVTSFGRGCGRSRFPGVYAQVPALIDFLTDPEPVYAPVPTFRLARIVGTPEVGEKLTCERGPWQGENIKFDYLWLGGFSAGPLSTRRKAKLGENLAGKRVTCDVIGFNAGGLIAITSRPVRVQGNGQ